MMKVWAKAEAVGMPVEQLCQVLDLIADDQIHILLCGTGQRRIIDRQDVCGVHLEDVSSRRTLSLFFQQTGCQTSEVRIP